MAEPRNLANVIMIIAGIYLLIEAINGWLIAVGVVLIIFGLGTWGLHHYPFKDEERKFLESKTKSEEARVLNFHAGTRQLLIQTKLLERGLKT